MYYFDHQRRWDFAPDFFLKIGKTLGAQVERYLALPPDERIQTDPPLVWKESVGSEITSRLATLSGGKCAFCECVVQPLHAYRFRPPFSARPIKQPKDRLCYIWLALNWENFFPICDACRPTDQSEFLVRGARAEPPTGWKYEIKSDDVDQVHRAERALIYFPGEDDEPFRKMRITASGALEGITDRFRRTIKHFDLNRSDLMRMRQDRMNEVLRAFEKGGKAFASDFSKDGPLASTVRSLVFEIARRAAPGLGEGSPSNFGDALSIWNMRWEDSRNPAIFDGVVAEFREGMQAETVEIEHAAAKPGPANSRIRHPRIATIEVTNFKSLENIRLALRDTTEDEALDAPCLLILGENATGKSSLLEALALALTPAGGRGALGVTDPDKLILAPEYMGSRETVAPETSKVRVGFHGGGSCALKISGGVNREISGPVFSDGADEHAPPLVFAFGAHRLNARSDQVKKRSSYIETLFSEDSKIPDPNPWLAQLARNDETALNEIVAALRNIIEIEGEFSDIAEVWDEEGGTGRCEIKIKRTRRGADGQPQEYLVPQRLEVASSGFRAVIALVCDIFYGLLEAANGDARAARHANAIVLIDEIEAHLHPRWKLTILHRLRLALPNTTFIVSSHDPLCIRGMFPGEVMIMNRYQSDGDSKMNEAVEMFQPDMDPRVMTVEQLLTSDFFQLVTVDEWDSRNAWAALEALTLQSQGVPAGELSQAGVKAAQDIRAQITQALPYGRTEVTLLVQRVVAEYLAERRSKSKAATDELREKAERELKSFLGDLIE